MMTPRSVEMGNKVYKLHVKVGARKEILELPPDSSLDILHQHIYRIFQIPESQQRLVCNGKPLNFSSNLTLKQARVGNGSKILVQTCDMYTSSQSTHNTTDSNQRDRNTVRNNGDCRNTGSSCPEAAVDDAASKLRDLEEIDTKALQLEQTVHNLGLEFNKLNELQKKEQCELSRLKKESVSAGELLMKNLEKLDQISIPLNSQDVRAERKRIATLLNKVLDINDTNINDISTALKNTH